jgi:PKD repeat protein
MRRMIYLFLLLITVSPVFSEVLYISPDEIQLPPIGELVTVEVKVRDVQDLFGIQFDVRYDPAVLRFVSAEEGDFLSSDGAPTFFNPPDDDGAGNAKGLAISRLGDVPGLSGEGTIAKFSFRVESHIDSSIELVNVLASDPQANGISMIVQGATLLSPKINQPPQPSFQITGEFTVGSTLTFDASDSVDPDGRIVSYQWDFGDGEKGNGVAVQHEYSKGGTYAIVLTVTDDKGASVSLPKQIEIKEPEVKNLPPIPVMIISGEQMVGKPITFDASGSIDPDGQVVSYRWDFGDGGSSNQSSASHIYSSAGTYTVKLTVTDDKGSSVTAQKDLVISQKPGQPPVASFKVEGDLVVGEELIFDASGSTDPDGRIVSYEWDFGDGVKLSGKQVIHSYLSSGEYLVKLIVKDETGLSAEAVRRLSISAKLEPAIRKHQLHSPALMMSLNVVKAGKHAHAFVDIWEGEFEIEEGQFLEYQIIFLSGGAAYNGGVDLYTSDGSTLGTVRGPNGETAKDQFDLGADVSTDLSQPIEGVKHAALNRWYHRMISLDLLAGKTLEKVMLGMMADSPSAGEVSFFVDNIQITDGEHRLLDIYIDQRKVPINGGVEVATSNDYLESVNVTDLMVKVSGLPKSVHPAGKLPTTWARVKLRGVLR